MSQGQLIVLEGPEGVGKTTQLRRLAEWLTTTGRSVLAAQENFDKVMGHVNDWILEGIEKGATSSIITLG